MCKSQKLCEDEECKECFNKSFASNEEKARYWSDKNVLTPRQVFKNSDNNYFFDCNCGNTFVGSLGNASSKNVFCPYCVNKTDTKFYNQLHPIFPNLIIGPRTDIQSTFESQESVYRMRSVHY
jgi:hypothetical protein